jgi:nitroimidazol reductase NimA-like FMN-containing flavoprotein (pyridoxamine 5'-phosphate oxidase superfamily)
MQHQPPSDRTRIRRVSTNADYDRTTLHAIVDDAHMCHVAFADEKGVHNIPMACWREGDHLYIHGSNGGRLVKTLGGGAQVCVTITHLDGLVLARSAFSHSMNYRAAMIYGQFEVVQGDVAKRKSMDIFLDSLLPGRGPEVRPGNDKEFAATTVLRIPLGEAACKVRAGGPNDEEEDMAWPVWAGVLPFERTRAPAVVDEFNQQPTPDYVRNWSA